MRRTIFLSCSQKKHKTPKLLPAIQRYDGGAFRVVRRYLKEMEEPLDIFVVSARFGLINGSTLIPNYDHKLISSEIENLQTLIFSQATQEFAGYEKARNKAFINLGKKYRKAFEPTLSLFPTSEVTFASGPSGRRLASIHDWLYGSQSPLLFERTEENLVEEKITFCGADLVASKERISKLVRDEIAVNGERNIGNYQAWFVTVDGFKVSPKWIVSQLTGLPVSKFHSDQARKALNKLGIDVKRKKMNESFRAKSDA